MFYSVFFVVLNGNGPNQGALWGLQGKMSGGFLCFESICYERASHSTRAVGVAAVAGVHLADSVKGKSLNGTGHAGK
jgi:hypothetical protein